MPLTGTFDCLPLDEALGVFARRRATGRLHVRTSSTQASLRLLDGKVVGAQTRNGNGGNHTSGWHELVEEICCRALRDQRGAFDFVPEETVEPFPGPPMSADQVIKAARQRVAEWAAIEAVIPSFEVAPRLAESLSAEQITFDRDQWALVAMVDGRRTITALAHRLGLGLLRCCQLLKPLMEAGAVVVATGAEKVAPLANPTWAVLATTDDTQAAQSPIDSNGAEAQEGTSNEGDNPLLFSQGRRLIRRRTPATAGTA
jgi:hypothetical protein